MVMFIRYIISHYVFLQTQRCKAATSLRRFMFINFGDFVKDTERTVRQVLDFVGSESKNYRHVTLPPAMKNNYRSRQMHPSVVAALTELFREPNRR
ncbi:hypothetical protein Vretifemale_11984, partial [Volvox reticuliferus]